MKKILFIVGPTATGKSDVAYELARRLEGEIVSCDSMLVYRQANILTAKPSLSMRDTVPHHCIDLVSVEEAYDAFTYYKEATALIERMVKEGIPIIVCGGTGLYFKALLDGIFEGSGRDESARREFEAVINQEGTQPLYKKLQEVDPAAAEKISVNDARRIIRALEVYQCEGVPISRKQKERAGLWGRVPMDIIGLAMERETMYARIDERVDSMITAGAVEEAKNLLTMNLSMTAEKIIGVKEIGRYLSGEITLDEAKELMKRNTRHFAKRQVTWFKREERIHWREADNRSPEFIVESILSHNEG